MSWVRREDPWNSCWEWTLDTPQGPRDVQLPRAIDLSRLWDGVALWVALEMVDWVAHGAHGPPVSYWPR
jgi:hypothetical protein